MGRADKTPQSLQSYGFMRTYPPFDVNIFYLCTDIWEYFFHIGNDYERNIEQ